ncbi:YadA-like family protein [Scandinavium sp. V105_16]|uniref:YadA-like family protein n=1 Tax=Scandinavium lactucae TaxID=3095028 RepID=A0AAJ2VVT9_9ENTR|nr:MULTISPECIES: YadA-like family protein [unclassified Scandinavium]MDX6022711.1 YadA-like family protein [Scandinavium sp. V105_16]MDX6033447.1 YadA-like family protein [Scandinavium sp. V105_12]
MKFIVPACLFFTAIVPSAYALTGTDLDAANDYFTLHPEIQKIAPYVYNEVMKKNSLQEANTYLSGNKPWNPATNGYLTLGQITLSTTHSVPMVNLEPSITQPVSAPDPDTHSNIDNPIAPLKSTLPEVQKSDDAENGLITQNQRQIAKTEEGVELNQEAIKRTREVVTANSNAIVQDEKEIEKNQEGLKQTHDQIQRTREAIADNSSHLADNSHEIDRNHKGIAQNQDAIVKNGDAIKQDEKLIVNNQTAIAQNHRDIDINGNNIETVHSEVRATQTQVSSNTAQIKKLNNNFSNLKSEVDSNKRDAAAGASGAMAQANIPQVIQGQTFSVGAGIGGYEGENAVAVGMSARVSQSVIVKASVSDDTQQNVGYGAGVSIGW